MSFSLSTNACGQANEEGEGAVVLGLNHHSAGGLETSASECKGEILIGMDCESGWQV